MAYTSRRSGRKVRDLLTDAGFSHDDCYYTNAVKCHPPGNRDPTDAELANCRPYLVEEVEAIEPTAVVATGKHAPKTYWRWTASRLTASSTACSTPAEARRWACP